MMLGGGFMKHMAASFKSNRILLKGNPKAKYQNFDKSYITDYPLNKEKKAPVFKISDPIYRAKLRARLRAENEKLSRKRHLLLLMTGLLIVGAVCFVLYGHL